MIPGNRYSVILADPPWTFATRSPQGKGRSPEKHYSCMTLEDIINLQPGQWAAEDAALFLWVTDPLLPQGLDLMEKWGFSYKTVAFYWAKTNRQSEGFFAGMGYWTRANPEMCLLGTMGAPKRLAKDVRRLIVAPRREHSRKPDEVYTSIQRLCPGPYLEMFAREERAGWSAWGNETRKFNGDETS